MKIATQHVIRLGARCIDYRVVRSRSARKLRIRVGPSGVEIMQPLGRHDEDVSKFLDLHAAWILEQLDRVERLRGMRRAPQRRSGEILYRGEPTRVRIESTDSQVRGNCVNYADGEIVIRTGSQARTPLARSLENWLRRQARTEITYQLADITARLRQRPGRVYVMGQRTKWGNCSATRNLSFNWRLILAPSFVMKYLVTHEAVHLAVPDHSARFWLTVQSHCREAEKAKQWLCSRASDLAVDVNAVIGATERPESTGLTERG